MALSPGTRLAAYEILALIGSGGMGEVYLARDPRLDRKVAIKVLPERFAADAISRLRFEREAKATATLSHPHICSVFDVGQDGSVPYIVMEYLDGDSLAERLLQGHLPLHTSIEYGLQIADALASAHSHGVIHRDLKPSNVMVVRSGVKLVDFGVAKLRPMLLNEHGDGASTTAPPATAHGTLLGTLQYMAPEQLEGSESDSAADLFSLGAVLYEMVTGIAPFGSDNAASIIAAILDREPPATRSLNPSVPPELDRLIAECLAKDRVFRPTAEMAAERLRTIAAQKQAKATPQHPRLRHKVVRSVAVIPFAATLQTESEDAFGEGMADSLITNLGSVAALRVISRSSTRQYKGSTKRPSEIASELRVDTVLRGAILEKNPGYLTIDVELIDGSNETCIWSGRYDCERLEVLNVEEQIAHAIVTKMRLSGALKDRVPRKRRLNRDSHEAFLKARFQFDNRLGNWLPATFDLLSTALLHDPMFAPAHAALSRWYVVAALRGVNEPSGHYVIDWPQACLRAEREARLALKCDPTLADAHAALAHVLCFRWRFDESEQAYRRSLELGPNLALMHLMYSEFLCLTERFDDAIGHAQAAIELDPFATTAYERLAIALYVARRFEDCVTACHQGLELSPSAGVLHYCLGQVQRCRGDLAASLNSLTIARDKMSNHPAARAALAAILIRTADLEGAERLLEELGKEAADPVHLAEVYTEMGRFNEALDNLELAFERRSPHLLSVLTDPVFDSLRTHVRFQRLIKGIGLRSATMAGSAASVRQD